MTLFQDTTPDAVGTMGSQESRAVTGPLASAMRSLSRCHLRRACSALVGRTRYRSEHGQYQPGASSSGLDAKKKTLRASRRDKSMRQVWREQARQLERANLVFVDETGSHIGMMPLYAYAPRGQRAIGKVPRNTGTNLTLIASLLLQGMGEALMLYGAADASDFEIYVEQLSAPSLKPGQS